MTNNTETVLSTERTLIPSTISPILESRLRAHGRWAYDSGDDLEDNPHTDTAQHQAWAAGWTAAEQGQRSRSLPGNPR